MVKKWNNDRIIYLSIFFFSLVKSKNRWQTNFTNVSVVKTEPDY